ncbi:hypothetical protein DQX05_10735 [Paenibacillus thiaminolyticus]|uniref:Uncharacterized protein n=1 Tax=Paenibacillus thiaminolyticus TaxID=49283 RepID=A0A3A3GN59_PANTH|nr:hypothetical protein DQX05_10735 [Paenibacillus thiaminolyticus]
MPVVELSAAAERVWDASDCHHVCLPLPAMKPDWSRNRINSIINGRDEERPDPFRAKGIGTFLFWEEAVR